MEAFRRAYRPRIPLTDNALQRLVVLAICRTTATSIFAYTQRLSPCLDGLQLSGTVLDSERRGTAQPDCNVPHATEYNGVRPGLHKRALAAR